MVISPGFLEPCSSDGADVGARNEELRVQLSEIFGGQASGDTIYHRDKFRSPPVHDLVADQRRDILGRLQPTVVRQRDELAGGDGWVGGEEQRHVDVSVSQ